MPSLRFSRRIRTAFSLVFALLALLPAPLAAAYETDQYHDRELPLADSTAVLDAKVNAALERVAAAWRGPRDELRFARAIYWQLGGFHWVDHIERFAMKSPEVARLPRGPGIYSYPPPLHLAGAFFFGTGERLRLAEVQIGSDKLGHFFSQGFNISAASATAGARTASSPGPAGSKAGSSANTPPGFFRTPTWSPTTKASFSTAAFSKTACVPGKGPIVRFENPGDGGRARILRPFTWRDHVNDYWDEALNPSLFGAALRRQVARQLAELCPAYQRHPGLFVTGQDAELARRYARVGMRDARYNRLDRICSGEPAPPSALAGK